MVPENVVDWVLVQLRIVSKDAGVPVGNARAGATIVTKAGFLNKDGSIVDASDPQGGVLSFEGLDFTPDTHDAYVAVKHRNHLAIIASETVSTSGDSKVDYVYEFNTVEKVFRGAIAVKQVGGCPVMLAGDANNDNGVDATDLSGFVVPDIGRGGYRNSDVNMDAGTDATDLSGFVVPNVGKGGQLSAF